jgi:ATP-dependent RNA helicase HelY
MARTLASQKEALRGYAEAMRCDQGDFDEYLQLRSRLSDLEKKAAKSNKAATRIATEQTLEKLRQGDVIHIGRTGSRNQEDIAVVIAPPRAATHKGGRSDAVGLNGSGKIVRLGQKQLPHGATLLGQVSRFPKNFSQKSAQARTDLASSLRNTVKSLQRTRSNSPGKLGTSSEIVMLREELRQHPSRQCVELMDHERWANRYAELKRKTDRLASRLDEKTGTVARDFAAICRVLVALGYLSASLEITDAGQLLRRLYAEQDLLLAQCLRDDIFANLKPADLAAVLAGIVYEPRREEELPIVPGNPQEPVAIALTQVLGTWQELKDLEAGYSVSTLRPLAFTLVSPVRKWANGKPIATVLADSGMAAGDFVRWCKQVIDVLNQLAATAPTKALRTVAREAKDAVFRGVVAYGTPSSD